jgi:hypothetical protein
MPTTLENVMVESADGYHLDNDDLLVLIESEYEADYCDWLNEMEAKESWWQAIENGLHWS